VGDGEDLLLAAAQARRRLTLLAGQLGEQRVDAVEPAAIAARVARAGTDQASSETPVSFVKERPGIG
jgi:hypothetical protein